MHYYEIIMYIKDTHFQPMIVGIFEKRRQALGVMKLKQRKAKPNIKYKLIKKVKVKWTE